MLVLLKGGLAGCGDPATTATTAAAAAAGYVVQQLTTQEPMPAAR
jgi:hypothetical protein